MNVETLFVKLFAEKARAATNVQCPAWGNVSSYELRRQQG
jgi:hypothetical protein